MCIIMFSEISPNLEDKLEILEEFKSYKNNVFKITYSGKFYVFKIYPDSLKNSKTSLEAINLTKFRSHGINVPEVIYQNSKSNSKNFILLEYIPGLTISKLIEFEDRTNFNRNRSIQECLKELAKWMAHLHQIKGDELNLVKGDCNLRNFIWTGREVYGLDFEETSEGDPREDLGEICFFLISNSLPLTPYKLYLVNWFIKSYERFSDTKISNISYFISKSARNAYKRRRKFYRI